MKKSLLLSVFSLIALGLVLWFVSTSSQSIATENADSKQDVPIDKTWEVTFSNPMDPATFGEGTVTVTDSTDNSVPISYELTSDNRKLIIHPPENLYMLNKAYTVTLSENVKSESSKPLKDKVLFSFHTTKNLPTVKDASHFNKLLASDEEKRTFTPFGDTGSEAVTTDSESRKSVSETNTQVEGVAEADTIKASEGYTYFIRNGEVSITSNDAPNAKLVTTIRNENFWPSQLYLQDDQLVILGHGEFVNLPKTKEKRISSPSIRYDGSLKVFVYDISSPENPSLQRTLQLSGRYFTSRIVNNHMYIVANQLTNPYLRNAEKPDLRPFVLDSAAGKKLEQVDYDSIRYFPNKSVHNVMTLASIDLTNPNKEASIESYLGASENAYVTKDHLYITSTERTYKENDSMLFVEDEFTTIEQFDLDDGDITFKNEQRVPGMIANQFSMDERNEVFSVATTTGGFGESQNPSSNHLYTFDLSLNQLGAVEGLAEGERIYSVRFIDNRAYLVTFEEVDPFFVIDLHKPKNPTVLGKLKIPGFSNYLHPVGEDRVLGFGQQTELEENPDGGEQIVRTTGLKISLFNVEDVQNPIEQDSIILGKAGYSELNYNHKALYQHPEQDIFGLPVQVIKKDGSSMFNGGYIFELGAEGRLVEKGRISLFTEGDEDQWGHSLKRMISVGKQLYAFSDQNMKAFDLDSLNLIQELELPVME
ncbi:beta-propeller domain-containing protein [Halobacillus salinus]|uniref:beta-propeller domain-containing protein n=1 Tax=Halobacillus salinus TaxID=192814 RepID=UPI0009A637A2|nr:beta-propeller domain-containing protein [Halobacillus salinus]